MRGGANSLLAAAFLSAATLSAAETPKFSATYDFGIGKSLTALSSVAGPGWREIADKNRTTGLEKISGRQLKNRLVAMMQKYADKETGDVGGEPVAEIGEISEAALRGEGTFPYAVELWRQFFAKGVQVKDRVTAAKLLSGFERTFPGIVPLDSRGEVVEFSPGWLITHVQSGSYRTHLPNGGFFESSWSNNSQRLVHVVRTTAKRIECHVRPATFMAFREVQVNGRKVAFKSSPRGCDFEAVPDADGVVRIELLHSQSWTGWWLGEKLCLRQNQGAIAAHVVMKSANGNG